MLETADFSNIYCIIYSVPVVSKYKNRITLRMCISQILYPLYKCFVNFELMSQFLLAGRFATRVFW